MSISAAKRKSLPAEKFGWPEKKKYPLDTPARVRAAASYLEKEHNEGKVPDSEYPKIKSRIRAAEKRLGVGPSKTANARGVAVRAQLGPGGHLHIRHLSGVVGGKVALFPGLVPLVNGDLSLAQFADKAEPVWIQIAKPGVFKGHVAGEFEMNAETFADIVRNFKATANRRVPVDFEHASEQDPTSGSIPIEGAPAQGWIIDLKVASDGNLWGLVEWLDPAREYIRQGKYKYFSPAIRFNSRDRVTGKPIGARLTSGALTNQPFLDGMAPLVARDFDGTNAAGDGAPQQLSVTLSDKGTACNVWDDVPVMVAMSASGGGLAHAPGEYMGSIRAALSMHPYCSAAECGDRLEDLYDHLEAADFDHTATHEGVELARPCCALRDLVGARPGETWDTVFDAVRSLIQAAIDEHEVTDHLAPGGADMDDVDDTDGGGEDDPDGGAQMRDPNPNPAGASRETPTETTTMDFEKQLKDLQDKHTVLASEHATFKTENAELKLRVKELEGSVKGKDEELKTLRDQADKRKAADEQAQVDAAFETYKDKKNLSDEDKEGMLIVLRANPDRFAKMYPAVPAGQRHLQRMLTTERGGQTAPIAGDGTGAGDGAPVVRISMRALTRRIMRSKHVTLEVAQQMAERHIKRMRAKGGAAA